jgi:hypothetical protein
VIASIRLLSSLFIALSLCVAAPAWSGGHEKAVSEAPKTAKLMKYTRLYTGDDNETHFEDVVVTFAFQDYGSEDIPPVWFPLEGVREAEGFHFIAMQANWGGTKPYPAPRRQFIIPLSGEMTFYASDGEERTFGPGDVLLAEDTTGAGHLSRMVSTGMGLFAVVPIPDDK